MTPLPWRPGCYLRTIRFPEKVKTGGRVLAGAFKPSAEDLVGSPAGLSIFDCGGVIRTDEDLDGFQEWATKVAQNHGATIGRLGICHVFDDQLEKLGLPPTVQEDPEMADYAELHNLIPCPDELRRQLPAQFATGNGHVKAAIY